MIILGQTKAGKTTLLYILNQNKLKVELENQE